MEYRGYSEEDLASNRAAVLLYGGSADERKDWAREVAGNFASEGPLLEAGDLQALQNALTQNTGVVYVPDLLALVPDAQGLILQALRGIEERPKLVLGLSAAPPDAVQRGMLREDLSYRLQLAHVNLDSPGLRETLRSRRLAREEALASVKTLIPSKPKAKARPAKAKPKVKKKTPPKKKKTKTKTKKAPRKAKRAAKKAKRKSAKKKSRRR